MIKREDIAGCATWLILDIIAYWIAILYCLKWTSGQSLIIQILIWTACVIIPGFIAYILFVPVMYCFVKFFIKK